MLDLILTPLRKYATFAGRSQRIEYWFFVLFIIASLIALSTVDAALETRRVGEGAGLLSGLFVVGMLIPWLAVLIRRLHDTGRSGWWFLVSVLPLVCPLVLLVMLLMDSQSGSNEYGPNPKTNV